MSAQSSLKAKAEAILERTMSAQSEKNTAQYPHIAQKVGNFQHSDIEKIRAWLNHIGEPEDDHHVVLNKCRRDPEALAYYLERAMHYERDKRQQKVLNMLAESPDKKRAYISDATADIDNVILTVAIRGVATFDMLIPKVNWDPFLFIEMIENELLQ